MSKLLNCPFCGSANIKTKPAGNQCHKCGAWGPDNDSEHDWNTRPQLPAEEPTEAMLNAGAEVISEGWEEETSRHLAFAVWQAMQSAKAQE